MVGADESTELWRHPISFSLFPINRFHFRPGEWRADQRGRDRVDGDDGQAKPEIGNATADLRSGKQV